MNDAIGYIRVSSEEQAESGLGLEAQRQRIAAYCTMKGLRLAEVFEDPGISAGKPLASRPAGSRLLATARKGKAVVVVAKLERLFRSVADAANVIDDFDKKGIQLVAISEAFDMTSPCSTPRINCRAGWKVQTTDSRTTGPVNCIRSFGLTHFPEHEAASPLSSRQDLAHRRLLRNLPYDRSSGLHTPFQGRKRSASCDRFTCRLSTR
jgi:hypothetical protein